MINTNRGDVKNIQNNSRHKLTAGAIFLVSEWYWVLHDSVFQQYVLLTPKILILEEDENQQQQTLDKFEKS